MEKKEPRPIIFIAAIFLTVILFIADLYVMINMPKNILLLILLTLLLLGGIFAILFFGAKEKEKKEKSTEERFEYIFKTEKAIFLLLKKTGEELETLGENSQTCSEDIMKAQKAAAKIMIARSKENADAIMNSNDKVMERFFDFEDKLDQNNELIGSQKTEFDQQFQKMQQQISSAAEGTENTIKQEIGKAVEILEASVKAIPDQIPAPQPVYSSGLSISEQTARSEMSKIESEVEEIPAEPELEEISAEPEFEELSAEPELEAMPVEPVSDSVFDDGLNFDGIEGFGEELSMVEAESQQQEESSQTDIEELPGLDDGFGFVDGLPGIEDDLSPEGGLDDLPSLDDGLNIGEELSIGGGLDDLPSLDDGLNIGEELSSEGGLNDLPSLDDGLNMGDDLNIGGGLDDLPSLDDGLGAFANLGDEPAMEEISLEEAPAMEEIPLEEAPVIEEMPPEEPPAVEEAPKPPAPDLSNPNKLMTPDEIAALIANL
ncbi:MAG: hypothetical protein ACI4AD_02605 [Roseburia sp.]